MSENIEILHMIICKACGWGHGKKGAPVDSPRDGTVRVMVCDRGRTPTPVDVQVDPANGQTALFSMARRPH